MDRFPALLLAAAVGLAAAGAAEARAVTAGDPASVSKALKDGGYPAELAKDETGDPMINSRAEGTDFVVHFYGCEENRACTRVQFMFSDAEAKNDSLDRINAWNAKNYFGRAYRTEQGVRLEMDVDLDDGGMSPKLFVDNVEWWATIMEDFVEHVSRDGDAGDDEGTKPDI
jgi:hypothetical protein